MMMQMMNGLKNEMKKMNKMNGKGFHSNEGMRKERAIYNSILDTIGNTPIVKVNNIKPNNNNNVNLYVKCEFFNPLSSVKDRLALAVIEDAERTGKLKKGQTVVEGKYNIFHFVN